MDFVALDVETANASLASICQIGIVEYQAGMVSSRWKSLIDPKEEFDGRNIAVHGITEEHVKGAPTFAELAEHMRGRLCEKIVVSHTHFDRASMTLAAERHHVPDWGCRWLDSARVVRRVWPQFAKKGYGLKPVCEFLGITFQHHDAEEDAYAAGEILLRAVKESSIDVEGWYVHSRKRVVDRITREGDPDGPFAGESLVFTGALAMPRREAATMAAQAGFNVADSVSQATTILVVGDQDLRLLAGQTKSSKHRKAEDLIDKGFSIRIVGETDFHRMMAMASDQR